MAVYDVSKIESTYEKFDSIYTIFKNNRASFDAPGLKRTIYNNDISKFVGNLNTIFEYVNSYFLSIEKFWGDYINDIKAVENSILGISTSSAISGDVATAIKSIPTIKVYSADLKTRFSSLSAVINSITKEDVKNLPSEISATLKDTFSSVIELHKTIEEVLYSACANITNMVVGFAEGIVSFLEALSDCLTIVGAAIVSIPLLVVDAVEYLSCDPNARENYEMVTKSFWCDDIMPYVGDNLTDELFADIYNNPVMSVINDSASDSFKRGGAVYDVLKNVGYITGIVVASSITAGAAGVSANVVSSVIAGAAKTGETAQNNYNKLSDLEKQDGSAILLSNVKAVAVGGIEGVVWAYTYGNGLTNVASKSGASAFVKTIAGIGALGDVGNYIVKSTAKATLQGTKEYAKAAINNIGEEDYLGSVFNKDTLTNAYVSAATSFTYDLTVGLGIKIGGNALNAQIGKSVQSSPDIINKDLSVESLTKSSSNPGYINNRLFKIITPSEDAIKFLENANAKKSYGTLIKEPMKDLIDFRDAA